MASSDRVVTDNEARLADLCRRHTSTDRAEMTELWGVGYEHYVEGEWIVSTNGRRFLNMAGYGTQLLGTQNHDVIDRVVEQIHRQSLSCRSMESEVTVEAAEMLAKLSPQGLDKVFFTNSGAEAVEAAIKFARAAGYKRFVVAADGYHGKSIGALSVTGRDYYQEPFRLLMPGVQRVPFNDIEALSRVVSDDVAVILEPVQGEAGVVIPDSGYLAAVRHLCDQTGALLIVDEIQTGLGRCGCMWRSAPVVPDILLTGKTLSGGVIPVAAVVTSAELYEPFDRDLFLHASTFGGSPVACSAVLATLEKLVADDVPDRSLRLGEQLERIFREITQSGKDGASSGRYPHLTSVRGEGSLWAMEFIDETAAGAFYSALVHHGVVANHSLNASNIVRFTPSAYIGERELMHFRSALKNALEASNA